MFKKCTICQIHISSENAYKRTDRKCGIQSKCKKCDSKIRKLSKLKDGIGEIKPCEQCGNFCKRIHRKWLCSVKCRIEGNMDIVNDCWIWRGKKMGKGYGEIMINTKRVRLHRLSYELYKGPIVDNLYVLHSCDIKSCFNPSHLRLGTHTDNQRDRSKNTQN